MPGVKKWARRWQAVVPDQDQVPEVVQAALVVGVRAVAVVVAFLVVAEVLVAVAAAVAGKTFLRPEDLSQTKRIKLNS